MSGSQRIPLRFSSGSEGVFSGSLGFLSEPLRARNWCFVESVRIELADAHFCAVFMCWLCFVHFGAFWGCFGPCYTHCWMFCCFVLRTDACLSIFKRICLNLLVMASFGLCYHHLRVCWVLSRRFLCGRYLFARLHGSMGHVCHPFCLLEYWVLSMQWPCV